MHIFLLFIISSFVSFLGSLQLGPVNLAVIKKTLGKGIKPALYIAIGGTMPELIYSWLAINAAGISFLNSHLVVLQWLLIPFFLIIGLFNILRKNQPSNNTYNTTKDNGKNLIVGFFLALFNVQLFPFWLSVIIFLKSFGFMQTHNFLETIAFTAGATIGALALLVLLIYLTNRNRNVFENKLRNYNLNTIFGCLFVILGIVQLINLLLNT
jgi:threonine/homoserine/homoserine lactone efflux protein